MTVYSGKQIEGGFDFIWEKVTALRTHIIVRSSIEIPGSWRAMIKLWKADEQNFSFRLGIRQFEIHCKQLFLETFSD